MQTDTVFAYQVENNDYVLDSDGTLLGYVYLIDEEGDYIHLDIVDDDIEHTVYPFGPFDSVTIVTSFEDDEEED